MITEEIEMTDLQREREKRAVLRGDYLQMDERGRVVIDKRC